MVQSLVMEFLYRFKPYILEVGKILQMVFTVTINISQRNGLSVITFESDTVSVHFEQKCYTMSVRC